MSDFEKFRNEQLQDPEFLEYYLDMMPASNIAKAMIAARIERDLSQKDLAELTGIHQTDISRLERCEGNPSLKTIKKIAKGLGLAVKIQFVPIQTALKEQDE